MKTVSPWLDSLSMKQLAYAARRVGVMHVGMSREETVAAIRKAPRRLNQTDVKHMRKTWAQVEYEIDWKPWMVAMKERVGVHSPAFRLEPDPLTSQMLFARDICGYTWVNMRLMSRAERHLRAARR